MDGSFDIIKEKIVLKKVQYTNPNLRNDPDAPTLEAMYVIVGKECYFSGIVRESYCVMLAEAVIEAIAKQERVEVESFQYFDVQTHLCGHPYIHPGEHKLRPLSLERLDDGRLNATGGGAPGAICPLRVLELFKELIGMEAPGKLGQMYREGFYKRGSSQEVDQALLDVEMNAYGENFRKDVFLEKWETLLLTLAEHPDEKVMNFGPLLISMGNPEISDEALLFTQIFLQINPSSWDVWVSLGSKYEERGNLTEARAAYLKSVEILMAIAKEKNLPPTDVIWADISASLRYAAKVESAMGDNSQALARALQACRLLKGWGHKYSLDEAFHLVGEIAGKLGMQSLAEQFHNKAESYKQEWEELTTR